MVAGVVVSRLNWLVIVLFRRVSVFILVDASFFGVHDTHMLVKELVFDDVSVALCAVQVHHE